jgi:hypothetical protein
MNQFLHLIQSTGWRVRIFDLRDQDIAIRDVAAFALCKNGEVVPLIHIINGVLETPPPSSDVWAVDLLGPSDGDTTDLPVSLLHTKLSFEAPLDQKLSNRADAAPAQATRSAIPKDTAPLDIQILTQIDSAEREIDRGMDTERLICRCHGDGDILETIERLRAEHLIFVDPVDHRGCDFYRLTDKARAKLRDFRNSAVSER